MLGGCCCSHIGAVEGLASRHDRLGVIWIDAHGDLNTPETSPSGNQWGMPLRMLIDGGAIDAHDVALIGARNLDPPEVEFIAAARDPRQRGSACSSASTASTSPSTATSSSRARWQSACPSPAVRRVAEVEKLLCGLRDRGVVIGAGLTGLAPDPANVEKLERLATALGF